MDRSLPVVILIGGWSPGPLIYLKRFLQTQQRCNVVEPKHLPMPPFPGSWCWDRGVITMVMWLCLSFMLISRLEPESSSVKLILRILFGSMVCVWFRFLAAVVVRSSIRKGVQLCREEAYRHEGNIVFVAFSWGGAVVSEMVAQDLVGGEGQPSALLIAPTTSLVASVAMQTDAALRMGFFSREDSIHVVHGTLDSEFCPHQDRWNSARVTIYSIDDNHIFMRRSSRDELSGILFNLVASRQRSE